MSDAFRGNNFLLQIAGTHDGTSYTTVGALRGTSFSVTTAEVDVTTKDLPRWQKMLEGGGLKSFSVTADGIYEDVTTHDLLKTAVFNATTNWNFNLIDEAGNEYAFRGLITSYDESGGLNEPQTFTLTITSDGAVTYTPAS